MKQGDKILLARPGYYPLLIRARVGQLARRSRWFSALIHYSGAAAGDRNDDDEGLTWCRGHDLHSKEADALRVAVTLS